MAVGAFNEGRGTRLVGSERSKRLLFAQLQVACRESGSAPAASTNAQRRRGTWGMVRLVGVNWHRVGDVFEIAG